MALDPHEQRLAARTAHYPNTLVEKETIAQVDSEVFSRVAVYEEQIAAAADKHMQDAKIDVTASEQVIEQLHADIVSVLRDGGSVSGEVAVRYQQLRALAERAISELERAATDAEWHRARVADPYQSYVAIVRKWPLAQGR